ncbi:MAG: hypothetical protein HY962_03220 [Ignavibacteriae bacterium]|nr:hypothetical protein [Ignavibacteriota bacterium]
MKPLIIFTFALFFSLAMSATVHAQSVPGAEKKDAPAQEQTAPDSKGKKADPAFVDDNNDGIDDRKDAAGKDDEGNGRRRGKGQHRRDAFIDRDGDGINDARCDGFGFRRGNGRQLRGAKK